jgi:acetyl-CoA carboxylase biotin carboxyl carrier protein
VFFDKNHAMAQSIKAPITGTIWQVLVKPGDAILEGGTLVILESMKMEIPVDAEDNIVIVEVRAVEGAPVTEGDVLFVVR